MGNNSETVVVACNLRNGLNIGGHIIKGYFQEPGQDPPPNIRGYMLTPGFPRKLWEEWRQINEESDLVVKHFVMAGNTLEEVRAEIFRCVGARSAPIFGSKPYPGGR